MKKFQALVLLAAAALAGPASAATGADSGDTAWMLTATLLVIMMSIPGLALFYGGMVRRKNALSVLLQVFAVFSVICLLWAVYGYSLAFKGDGAIIGNFSHLFLLDISPASLVGSIPEYVFFAFQAAFAAITLALIVGSFAERIRFSAVMVFSVVWFTLCYLPIAHMVWGGGWLFDDGALDFAGGTVIHINAGVAALVGAFMVGKRRYFGRQAMPPHSLALTMTGAALLWVGWFGFNAGSAVAANGIAGLAFVNTLLGPAAAVVSWLLVESLVKGKASALGAASGAVAGLVAVTPAAGWVGPMGSIIIGFAAGPVCFWGVTGLKAWLKVDDSCDVFGIHGLGGILGAILTGVFADTSLGGVGYAEGQNMLGQLWVQIESVGVTCLISAVAAFIAFKVADKTVGLRVSDEDETRGLDISCHGESAYNN